MEAKQLTKQELLEEAESILVFMDSQEVIAWRDLQDQNAELEDQRYFVNQVFCRYKEAIKETQINNRIL